MLPVPYAPVSRWNSATLAITPVFVHFIRAGSIAMPDWVSLRFIDHAPTSVWIITGVTAVLVLAVLESQNWLNFKGRWYFSVSLRTLLIIWVGSVALAYVRYGVGTKSEPENVSLLKSENRRLYLASLTPEQRATTAVFDLDKQLRSGDRQRLSDGLFEFSQVLDEANQVWGRANILGAQINLAGQNGGIAKDVDSYMSKLETGIAPCSVELYEASVAVNDVKRPSLFGQERDCWSPFRSERQARPAGQEVAYRL